MQSMAKRFGRAVVGVALAALAASCGVLQSPDRLPAGTPIDQARGGLGGPNGQYALAGGGTRLEFARHQETFMLDFDAAGRLVSSRQVLTEADFATIVPGLPRDEVLLRIGHPTWIFNVGWQRLQVWNYRFRAPLGCVIFQVSISADGRVREAAQGYDPACDAPSRD